MAGGFLQIMDPEVFKYMHCPTLTDHYSTAIDYLCTIVKRIGNHHLTDCKSACVELMHCMENGKMFRQQQIGQFSGCSQSHWTIF
jgi:hypothetical protein